MPVLDSEVQYYSRIFLLSYYTQKVLHKALRRAHLSATLGVPPMGVVVRESRRGV